jgi:hypothetical protein
MTTATHARLTDYGKGPLDPATATCDQHVVAAPEGEDARGYSQPIDTSDLECVVCPTPYADLIGTPVHSYWSERTYSYGGGGDVRSGYTLHVAIASGRGAVIFCDPVTVMPASMPIATKDPRVVVEKMTRRKTPYDNGIWLMHLPDLDGTSRNGFKTKTEATATGLRRLAVDDYHARRQALSKIGAPNG